MNILIDHATYVACLALVREMEAVRPERWGAVRLALKLAFARAVAAEAVDYRQRPALLRPQI